MKKEIPLLFQTEMVKSTIDLLKTMTRRTRGLERINENPDRWEFSERFTTSGKEDIDPVYRFINMEAGLCLDLKCPYGKPGDILWVKEAFTILDYWEDSKAVHVMYEDSKTRVCDLTDDEWNKFIKWQNKMERKPSLFMFKSLSRIWLEVTERRVERLWDITEEDAKKEGAKSAPLPDLGNTWKTHKQGFENLWQSINGPESLKSNPWVWVVSFRVLSTTGKPEIN